MSFLGQQQGVYFAVIFIIIQNLCLIYCNVSNAKAAGRGPGTDKKNWFRLVSLTSKVRFKIWPPLPARNRRHMFQHLMDRHYFPLNINSLFKYAFNITSLVTAWQVVNLVHTLIMEFFEKPKMLM